LDRTALERPAIYVRRMTRDLIWLDSRAGLAVGLGVLGLSPWLAQWFGLPRLLIVFMGVANVCYGVYSGWLFRRRPRPMVAIGALVIANGVWTVTCLVAAYRFAPTATRWGVAQLVSEGLIVGTLAVMEWRARSTLARG
jgi:hypothetical protein